MSKKKCDLCMGKVTKLINYQRDSREIILQKLFTARLKIDELKCICFKCNVNMEECYLFYKRVESAIFDLHYSIDEVETCSKEETKDPFKVKVEIDNNSEDLDRKSVTSSRSVFHYKQESVNGDDYKEDNSENCFISNKKEIGEETINNCDNRQNNVFTEVPIVRDHSNNELNYSLHQSCKLKKCNKNVDFEISDSLESCEIKKINKNVDPLPCTCRNKHIVNCKHRKKRKIIKASKRRINGDIFKNRQPAQYTLNFEDFPKELMRGTKFIVPDYEKDVLINAFYDLTCRMCSQDDPEVTRYEKMPELFSHYETVHKIKPFVTCCDKKLKLRQYILYHMVQHIQPSIFQCTHCTYFGSTPGTLKSHIKQHLPESERPSYQCDQCEKSFVEPNRLKLHKMTHLPVEEKRKLKCKFCDKTYFNPSRLTAHIAEDHKGRRFLCSDCGRSYKSKKSYELHLVSKHNTGERDMIKCQLCDEILKKSSILKHMRRHNEPNIFCTLCNYKTYENSILKHHMRVWHSDEKKYICTVCDKAFKMKSTLITHMSQHTGDAKYSCSFCPKTFFSSGNYYSHQNRMHKAEVKRQKETKKERILAMFTEANSSHEKESTSPNS